MSCCFAQRHSLRVQLSHETLTDFGPSRPGSVHSGDGVEGRTFALIRETDFKISLYKLIGMANCRRHPDPKRPRTTPNNYTPNTKHHTQTPQKPPMKHPITRLIQLLALAIGLLYSVHGAQAQYPDYQQTLLNERVGFGRKATGGAGGEVYWVTRLDDTYDPATGLPTYGTLRWGVEVDDNPRWIMFAVNGTIDLPNTPFQVRSNKTIDGRGASITLTSYGMWIGRYVGNSIVGSNNVIVENLTFASTLGNEYTGLNTIMLNQGAQNVWIDHCTFIDMAKMAIEVTTANPSYFTDLTVSWCRFSYHPSGFNSPMLVGADPSEKNGEKIRITMHHNFFDRQTHRSPMLRFGKLHCFNNYSYNWNYYGMASVDGGQLFTEYNIFNAGANKSAVVYAIAQEPSVGYVKNANTNLKMNGAVTSDNSASAVFNPVPPCNDDNCYPYTPEAANSTLLNTLVASTGATRGSGILANMSTRANVQSGQGGLVSGFIITGSDTKRVIIRAIGPSLAPYFYNAMGNTTLRVYDVYGQQIYWNDNWQDDPNQAADIQSTGIPPSHYLEAAGVLYLAPGTYSAVIDGWGTGIASLEIYDLNTTANSKLVNISSRATVDPSNPPIAGFIAQSGWTKLIVRGMGPSLANAGIQNPISDPTLTLYNAYGTQIDYNNNWQDTPADGVSQFGLQPPDWREAVLISNVAPGNYTIILRDYWNAWGIGSIELYKM
jgi:pectate lyase